MDMEEKTIFLRGPYWEGNPTSLQKRGCNESNLRAYIQKSQEVDEFDKDLVKSAVFEALLAIIESCDYELVFEEASGKLYLVDELSYWKEESSYEYHLGSVPLLLDIAINKCDDYITDSEQEGATEEELEDGRYYSELHPKLYDWIKKEGRP